MSKALSVDLRERVVRAVTEGASCRAAAARFGVSASSAVRWCARLRETGSVLPRSLGGDRRSGRIEAHAPQILRLVARTPDLTLAELRAVLVGSGVAVGIATLWRLLDRHRITLKKDRAGGRAKPPRRPDAALGVVRGAARPRARAPGVHR